MKTLLAIFTLCSFPAFATNGITLHLYGGTTMSAKTSEATSGTIAGSDFSDVTKYSSGGTFLGGADLTFQSPLFVGLAFAAEKSDFKHSDSSTSADHQLAFYVIPRFEISVAMVDFWAGFGIGTMGTKFGTTSHTDTDGTTNITQSHTSGPAISPRVGVDVNLGRYSIGLQTSYTEFKGSFDFTGTSQSQPFNGHVDFHRSFMATSLRFGVNFL